MFCMLKTPGLCAFGSSSGRGTWRLPSGTWWRVFETTEGSNYAQNVIVFWPDIATAQTAYHSPDYQKARDVLGDGAERQAVFLDGLLD